MKLEEKLKAGFIEIHSHLIQSCWCNCWPFPFWSHANSSHFRADPSSNIRSERKGDENDETDEMQKALDEGHGASVRSRLLLGSHLPRKLRANNKSCASMHHLATTSTTYFNYTLRKTCLSNRNWVSRAILPHTATSNPWLSCGFKNSEAAKQEIFADLDTLEWSYGSANEANDSAVLPCSQARLWLYKYIIPNFIIYNDHSGSYQPRAPHE